MSRTTIDLKTYLAKKEYLVKVLGNKCSGCSEIFENEDLTVDHILPMSLLKTYFGYTEKQTYNHKKHLVNLRLMCRRCNQIKSNSIDWSNEKIIEILNFYIKIFKDNKGDMMVEQLIKDDEE